MSFSADGKMLLAQGGAPEYNLVLWVWEKSKVAAVAKTTNQQGSPVHSVSQVVCMSASWYPWLNIDVHGCSAHSAPATALSSVSWDRASSKCSN